MITNFNTPQGASAGTAKGSNTLVYLIVGAVIIYLGYKYVIKPEMDKRKAQEEAK